MNEIIKKIVKLSNGTISGSVLFGIEDPDSDIDIFFEKKEDFDFAVEILRREGGVINTVISREAQPAEYEEGPYVGQQWLVRAEMPAEIDTNKKIAEFFGTKVDLVLVDKIFTEEEILQKKFKKFKKNYGRAICHLIQFHEIQIEAMPQKDLKYILLMKERRVYF